MHSSQFKQLTALNNAYGNIILTIVGNITRHPVNTLENPLFVCVCICVCIRMHIQLYEYELTHKAM